MKERLIEAAAVLASAILSGCSGSGFITVGGSGAVYNPNNEYAPQIVRNQPTQGVNIGRAMLPMVGGE